MLIPQTHSFCFWIRSAVFLHIASSAHHFIDEQQLLGEDWCDVEELSLYDVVVPDVCSRCGEGLTCKHVYAKSLTLLLMSLLNLEQCVLTVES